MECCSGNGSGPISAGMIDKLRKRGDIGSRKISGKRRGYLATEDCSCSVQSEGSGDESSDRSRLLGSENTKEKLDKIEIKDWE